MNTQALPLTPDEQTLLVGLVWESHHDLSVIAGKLGGWQFVGTFMYGVGVGLGVLEQCKDGAE